MSARSADGGRGTIGRSILIVDDVSSNLHVLSSCLEVHGHVPLVARGGREAIERAELARPDLILLDVVMPGMDGFETCRRLKEREATRHIPVIFMTALTATDDKVKGFRAGAVDYVTKPLHADEVLARVDTHLQISALREQLALQNRQLRQEIAARERAQAALQRSNAELEQLAQGASEGMREPLRTIASHLQLVAERCGHRLDEEARRSIGYALSGAERLETQIGDMLAFSRVGTTARSLEPVDCARVVAAAKRHLQPAIDASHAVVTESRLPTVRGDATQLGELWRNLLGNAIKFRSEAVPTVHLSAEAVEGDWCFSVTDNGIGIAPESLGRIFAVFQQAHEGHAYPGTGIGLALCRRIVERHGGRLWAESAPGQGSVFRFTLPRLTP